MMFSKNPSPSQRGTAEVIPRQLAPSVGTLGVGTRASVALISTTTRPEDPIYFGSLCFTPHAPEARPIFDSLHEGVTLTFGIVRLRADRHGILRLPDAARTVTLGSSPLSTSTTGYSPGSLPNDSLEIAESETASIYSDNDFYPESPRSPVECDADTCARSNSV